MNYSKNTKLNENIVTFIQKLPQGLNLTQSSDLDLVSQTADSLYANAHDAAELLKLEKVLVQEKETIPLILQLAVKNARSKKILAAMQIPVYLSVVFAVYKEHQRILTQAEHEHGEDFLIRKIAQLDWLTNDFDNVKYELIVVDDGCPEKSGEIAKQIINKHDLKQARVLFLADAIDKGLPVTKPLNSTDQSRKGGAIQLGMWQATQTRHENHIIIFTDADLSTHLGQCGLLVDPVLNQSKDAAIASRRESSSVVVKQGVRNTRGKLFIYLWKRLLPELNYIVDTQCGFKAFTADTVRNIIDNLLEKQFAFDIELLLKTELTRKDSIQKAGVAWIDSEAASTTTDLQPYLPMLRAMVEMYRHYLTARPSADEFASFIESMNDEQWAHLVDHVPSAIAQREPSKFDKFDGIKVADLQEVIQGTP